MVDLLTLGEPLVCLTSHGRLPAAGSLTKSVGGAESNVAIGLARLGVPTAFVGRVGDDPLGEQIRRTLRGEGVDVSRLATGPGPTGLMIKEWLGPEEVRVYYYRRGSATAALDESAVPAGLVGRARRVHATGITLALGDGPAAAVHALLSRAREAGVATSFDPNFRRRLWSDAEAAAACRQVLALVDDLLLGEDEALAIVEADGLDTALDRLHGAGVQRVVIRRGGAGAVGSVRGEPAVEVPPHPATVVDTVGAGDAFTAGYLFEMLNGRPFSAALRTAAFTAARVVAHVGDYEGFPELHEYEQFAGGQAEVLR